MPYDRPQFREQDYAVRPTLRISAALMLGLFAIVLVSQVPQTFQLKAVSPKQCTSGKGQLLCEFGNWLNAMTPPSWQGPLAALGQIGMALVLTFGVWWLLKPVVTAAVRK